MGDEHGERFGDVGERFIPRAGSRAQCRDRIDQAARSAG